MKIFDKVRSQHGNITMIVDYILKQKKIMLDIFFKSKGIVQRGKTEDSGILNNASLKSSNFLRT